MRSNKGFWIGWGFALATPGIIAIAWAILMFTRS
jgi:hypothetical protein